MHTMTCYVWFWRWTRKSWLCVSLLKCLYCKFQWRGNSCVCVCVLLWCSHDAGYTCEHKTTSVNISTLLKTNVTCQTFTGRHSLSKSIFSTMFLGLTLSSWLWMNICPSSFSVQPYLFIQTFTWVSVKRITFSLLYSHNQEWMCDLRSPRGSPSISARSRCSMFWYVIPTTWQMTRVRQTQPFQTYHNSRIHTYAEYYINVKKSILFANLSAM